MNVYISVVSAVHILHISEYPNSAELTHYTFCLQLLSNVTEGILNITEIRGPPGPTVRSFKQSFRLFNWLESHVCLVIFNALLLLWLCFCLPGCMCVRACVCVCCRVLKACLAELDFQ